METKPKKTYPKRNYRKAAEAKHNFSVAFDRLWKKGTDERWTHAQFLQEWDRVLSHVDIGGATIWSQIPVQDQQYLMGYWHALLATIMMRCEFRYLVNGKFYTGSQIIDRMDGLDPSLHCRQDNAHYCYHWIEDGVQKYAIYS